ncbi:hypothetical protein [Lysobacter sp. A378]
MFPKVVLTKSLLLTAVLIGATAVSTGCAEGSPTSRPAQLSKPPITGVDELQTVGDFLSKLKMLRAEQKKAVFVLVRAKVEKNFQMVMEANAQPGTSGKALTDALKLGAVQAAALKMVAEAADWPEMADVYRESSKVAQALVRGELSKDELGEAAKSIDARTRELLDGFIEVEAHVAAGTPGVSYFAEKFGASLIANTKAYAWDIDASELQ